jgi:hypothetical protein
VEDLEDEVAGLSTRSDKLKSELEVIEILSKEKKEGDEAQRLSKVYKTTGVRKRIQLFN